MKSFHQVFLSLGLSVYCWGNVAAFIPPFSCPSSSSSAAAATTTKRSIPSSPMTTPLLFNKISSHTDKARAPFSMRTEGDMMDGGGGNGGGSSDLSPFNHVMLIGRLGAEPAIKYLDSGNCVLEVSLAVNKDMPPSRVAMGEQTEVDWIRIVAWGRVAEDLAQSARKGSRIMVMGKLTMNTWTDKYGQSRNDVKVRVKRTELLQSTRSVGNPELKYYNNWETDPASAGAGADEWGGDEFGVFSETSPPKAGGGAYRAGGGGGSSSSYQRKSTYGSSGGEGSSYGKKKWTPPSRAGGGGGGYGSGGGYKGANQPQPPPPPQFDEFSEEYDVDSDIPF